MQPKLQVAVLMVLTSRLMSFEAEEGFYVLAIQGLTEFVPTVGRANAAELYVVFECPVLQPHPQQYEDLFTPNTDTMRSVFGQRAHICMQVFRFILDCLGLNIAHTHSRGTIRSGLAYDVACCSTHEGQSPWQPTAQHVIARNRPEETYLWSVEDIPNPALHGHAALSLVYGSEHAVAWDE